MLRSKILTYLLIIVFALAGVNPACTQETLAWEDCVIEARANNPELFSAKEKVRQARSDKDIAMGAMLPQVISDAEGKRGKAPKKQKESNTYSYGFSGEQLAFDGFKTAADVGSAFKTINAEEYNYAVTSSNIRLFLKTAFTAILRAQDLIFLTEDIARRRKQNRELVKLRYDAGREHKGALLTAQADLAQAEFEISQAKRNLLLTQHELSKELGRQKFTPVEVKGNFETEQTYSEKPDMEHLAENTPFLRALIAKKDAARLNYASAQSEFFPKVFLDASYSDTASETKWPIKDSDKAWYAGVSISFPIFEGGTRIAQTSKTRSQWKESQANERNGHDTVIVTLERAWKDLQDALEDVSVKRQFVIATEERAKISSAQYSTGLVSFDNWIIIENDLVIAKKAYLNAQANFLIAEAYWLQAKGVTLNETTGQ
ncbi:MAG: TolC family protein [Candidatus Omnitrophota bacterium]